MLTKGITIDDAPDGKQEQEPASEADGVERQAEEEECDEDNAVEEDEEEVDMDVSIAACLEDRKIVEGVRRSSRLAGRRDLLRDSRMAALMQEQLYEDGCADDD
jgi:hypothetical protein